MAAGDPIAVTNSKITSLNVSQDLTFNAADADTADLAQRFDYTPTGKDSRIVIGIKNTTGTLAYSIGAGTGVFGLPAKAGTVAANKTAIIQIETGRYMNASGKVAITFTPASGTKLLTNHALSVFVVELQ